ncbi:TonB-dependent receptor [Roseovarius aestuarii]|nr:TonB-dependent receptor [Roseovarius aestuarii]
MGVNAGQSPVSGDEAKDTINPTTTTATRLPTKAVKLPYSANVITREDIEKSGATRLDHVLASVPGLQIGTQGNAYPHIATRGMRNTADILILVDGVPFQQLNGASDLSMLPIGIIERIEFVKGPASALYGRSAIGGVLQIFTKPSSDEPVYKQQVTIGSNNFKEALFSGYIPLKYGDFSVQAGVTDTDGFQDNTGSTSKFFQASYNRILNDWLTVGIVAQYSQLDAKRGSTIPLIDGQPAYGISVEDNFALPGARFEGEYMSLSFPLKARLGNGWELQNIFNVNRYDRIATGGITIRPSSAPTNKSWWLSDTRQEVWRNETRLDWKGQALGGRTALSFGFDMEKGSMDVTSPSWSFASQPTYLAPDFTTPSANGANFPYGVQGATSYSRTDQKSAGIFTGLEYSNGPWSVFAGLRWDVFETTLKQSGTNVVATKKGDELTKRFGLSYAVYDRQDTTVTLFGNYTEGFRPQLPTLSNSGGVVLPQLLDPEFARSMEAGVKVSALQNRLFAEVTYFDVDRKDAPRSYRTDPDNFLFTNARQKIKGVETQVRYKANDAWSGYAHYSYQDAVNTSFVTSTADYSGNTIRMAPKHLFGLGVNYNFGKFNWNVGMTYIGKRPLRDNTAPQNIMTLPSYTVWNTSLRYDADNYFVQGTINNITDAFYISDDFSSTDSGNAGAPREFMLTVGVRF